MMQSSSLARRSTSTAAWPFTDNMATSSEVPLQNHPQGVARLNLITICGSLRAASYNAMVARSLPQLAPDAMKIKASPPIDPIPHYNADIQARGFPDPVNAL